MVAVAAGGAGHPCVGCTWQPDGQQTGDIPFGPLRWVASDQRMAGPHAETSLSGR